MSSLADWKIKAFNDLSATELYDALALRINVFIVEQNCPYPETDWKDIDSLHVLGYTNGRLCAYARIVKPGISYKEVSIGRVATKKEYRGQGLGRELMRVTMDAIRREFGNTFVRISAQSYLVPFYSSFGFEIVGEEYLEDDMPHTEMLYAGIVN